jgi:hypothetical protein
MPHFLPLHKGILPVVMVLRPFAQENSVDLHSLGKIPLRLVMTVGGKHIDTIKNNESLSLRDAVFFLRLYQA